MSAAGKTGVAARSSAKPTDVDPPVVVYLPSISVAPHNTTTRIADVVAAELTSGPGTFSVASLDHESPALSDGRRILDGQGTPVLDLYTVTYRDRLPKLATDSGTLGVVALAKLLLLQFWYLVRAMTLFVGAGKRAKGPMAKFQLLYGLGGITLLALAVALTVVAILVAVGVIDAPNINATFAEVAAIGLTAVVTWVLARAAPTIRRGATLVQQLLDYAQDERQAISVVQCLGTGLDALIEEGKDRKIYVLGYSLGSLVALDYLCPRQTQLVYLDDRHVAAIRGLITIGNPLDFVRLYIPDYIDRRDARVPQLDWTNVFIPADVLGSNMADGNDEEKPTEENMVRCGGIAPTETFQYTAETLTWRGILKRRGFLSHGGYWREPGEAHCFNVLINKVLPALR